jgi:predicted secreted hydrolase
VKAFAVAVVGISWLAAHPSAKAEWWYYTGHLRASSGREFGFELTFFRGLAADGEDLDAAHFAITDISGRRFLVGEKLHRPFPGIAAASSDTLDVSIEDWSARLDNGRHELSAQMPRARLKLSLSPQKSPVFHGDAGISKKGPGPDDFSHYVSLTRMSISGDLTVDGRPIPVTGVAWFDHEWGPGGRPSDLAGWDWFSIQMSDDTELMLYRLRQKGGGDSPFSSGTFVRADGTGIPLSQNDFSVRAVGSWLSQKSGAVYPSGWRIEVPREKLRVDLSPGVANQELFTPRSTRVTYWEGACSASGSRAGHSLGGEAYVELTGYKVGQ